jgi:acetyltransferase-like isoleucine patch superfamily enzyme
MLSRLKLFYRKYSLFHFRKNPLLWLYSCYLTLSYIDEYKYFPAILFNSYVRFKIKKAKGASLIIHEKLFIENWLKNNNGTYLKLEKNASLIFEREFVLGAGIKIAISPNAKFLVKGRNIESGSGITGNSIILVEKYLEFGTDILIAWDTYFTDCDWHTVDNKKNVIPTIIGNHVWVGVGAKILKGANIGANSIVTTNSVVISGEYEPQSLLSGVPSKIVKDNIPNWKRDFIRSE